MVITNQRILILGATGLLGSHITKTFTGLGYEVMTHGFSNRGVDYSCDLSNPKDTLALFEHVSPAIVINLVALTNVATCQKDINLAMRLNAQTVGNINTAAAEKGQRCYIVHISTDHLYDGCGGSKEDDIVLLNNYALTKFAGEIALNNKKHLILRTNFFGKSLIAYRESFSDWIFRSSRTEAPFYLFDDVWFNPLAMRTLSEVIALCLKERLAGTYNLGSSSGMTKADFGIRFLKLIGRYSDKVRTREYAKSMENLVPRPRHMVTDVTAIQRKLGITLPSLEEEIESVSIDYE